MSAQNNQRLRFHQVHGDNISISDDGRKATRVSSFCNAVAFGHRPIKVEESICIRIAEAASDWNGLLRIGIINKDPVYFAKNMPRFLCPDLNQQEGCWAKALVDRYGAEGTLLNFSVRRTGDMTLSVNGAPQGLFLVGINTQMPMYLVMDIYGNTTSVEFFDPFDFSALRICNRSAAPDRPMLPVPNQPAQIRPLLPAPTQLAAASTSTATIGPQAAAATPAVTPRLPLTVPTPPPRFLPLLNASYYATAGTEYRPCSENVGWPRQPMVSPSTGQDESFNRRLVVDLPPLSTIPRTDPFTSDIPTAAAAAAAMASLNTGASSSIASSTDTALSTSGATASASASACASAAATPSPRTPVQASRAQSSASGGGEEPSNQAEECIICMTRKVDCVVVPCGHVIMCNHCATINHRDRGFCPLCRNPSREIVRLYYGV